MKVAMVNAVVCSATFTDNIFITCPLEITPGRTERLAVLLCTVFKLSSVKIESLYFHFNTDLINQINPCQPDAESSGRREIIKIKIIILFTSFCSLILQHPPYLHIFQILTEQSINQ